MRGPRSIGLIGSGALIVAGGAATLLRSTYVPAQSWRLIAAAVVVGVGVLLLLGGLKSSK